MSTTPPITDQSQSQSRYVQLPNGSYMEWPQGVSAEDFKAKAAKAGATPGQTWGGHDPDAPQDQPGALSRFGSSVLNATGLPSIYHAFADDPTPQEQASPYDADQNVVGRGLHRIVEGVKDAVGSTAHNVAEDANNGEELKGVADLSSGIFGGIPKHIAQQAHEGDIAGAIGSGLGLGGMIAGPEAAAEALRRIGPAAMRAGAGAVNHAVEATPKMMKYGANPGRGLIEEGITPNLTKFGMQSKLDAALPVAGQRVSDAVHGTASTVPLQDIAKSIQSPALEAKGVMGGPGGGGRSFAPVKSLWDSMETRAPGATTPIYGTSAPAQATAPDVWQTIQNIDRNTRFNPDPEVEGVNEVRRDMRGGLRSNLEEAVPDLHDVSQRYSDLRTADDALSRTAGRGSPLKSFKDMFAFPAETAGGHALYKFGKAASGAKANPFLWAPLTANQRSQ